MTLKSLFWSGVEGWGENADNCNWITIKILKIINKKINKRANIDWIRLYVIIFKNEEIIIIDV